NPSSDRPSPPRRRPFPIQSSVSPPSSPLNQGRRRSSPLPAPQPFLPPTADVAVLLTHRPPRPSLPSPSLPTLRPLCPLPRSPRPIDTTPPPRTPYCPPWPPPPPRSGSPHQPTTPPWGRVRGCCPSTPSPSAPAAPQSPPSPPPPRSRRRHRATATTPMGPPACPCLSPVPSPAVAAVGRAVEEVCSALNKHADVVAELFGRVSTELCGGFGPAVDSFVGFFHAVVWKVRLFSLTPCFAHLTLGFSPPGSRSRCCNRRRQ
uniref:Uncharacterized protein n=1 Tax=Aegilops tauschii subsp. strangulata TaxID=200361 RepID=A0A453IRE4_AEGTS